MGRKKKTMSAKTNQCFRQVIQKANSLSSVSNAAKACVSLREEVQQLIAYTQKDVNRVQQEVKTKDHELIKKEAEIASTTQHEKRVEKDLRSLKEKLAKTESKLKQVQAEINSLNRNISRLRKRRSDEKAKRVN